jgi:hypothetical protein
MNGIPKIRFSGYLIFIVLFVILLIGLYTMVLRISNEQKLINRGFVTLQRNSRAIKGKLRIVSIKNYNYIKGKINYNNTEFAHKNDSLNNKLYTTNIAAVIRRNLHSDSLIKDYLRKRSQIRYNDAGIIVKFNYDSTFLTSQQDSIVNDTLTIKNNFFADILDRDFFDDYVVFDSTRIFYKSLNIEIDQNNFLQLLRKNIYIPASYRLFTGKKDSSLNISSWNSGFISKTIINYNRYYQFIYPLKINNKTWYISGLMTNQHYIDMRRHVETWVLILVAILLVFALFGFQFLKLFMLSKTERINTSDLVLVSFSIAGIACIATLLILNINSVFNIRNNYKSQLKHLNKTLNDNFLSELNLMYNVVESYEKSPKNKMDEYLLSNINWSKSDSNLRKAVYNYPYFDYLFCSKSGTSDSFLATIQKVPSPPRIAYRQYYQKKDEWVLPGSNPEKRFRLESIYSNLSGDATVVLAKPSRNESNWVYCIATTMYSIMGTILPPGFEFRIIGQDGTILFHNNKKKNGRENFLAECDNKDEVREAMHNRVSAYIPLKISLKNYRSYIKPIGTLPLYLVTLCDTQEQNNFLSHINYILFIFLIAGIILALLCTCLFYYEKLNSPVGHSKSQADYEPGLVWLLPDTKKNDKYLIITELNLLIGLFISISFLFRGITVIQVFLIMFSVYSLCFISYYYMLKPSKYGSLKTSVTVLFTLLFLMSNITYCLCFRSPYLFMLVEAIAIILVSKMLFRNRKVHFSGFPHSLKLKEDNYIPYALFITSWLMISCVLPCILIFRTAAREETELLTKKSQIEIANKIERKNLDIDSSFVKFINPKNPYLTNVNAERFNLDSLKSSLKTKGNYFEGGFYAARISASENQFDPDRGQTENFIILNRFLRQMFRKEDIRSYQMFNNVGSDKKWFWKGGYLSTSKSDFLNFIYNSKQKNTNGFFESYQIILTSSLPDQMSYYSTNDIRVILFHVFTFIIVTLFVFLIILQKVKHVFVLENNFEINKKEISALSKEGLVYAISCLHQDQIRKSFLNTHEPVSLENSDALKNTDSLLVSFNPYPERILDWLPLFKSLEKPVEDQSAKITLLSCYSPQQIIDMSDDLIKSAPATMKEDLRDFRNRLIKIFSNFKVYFIKGRKFIQDETGNFYHYLWNKCTLNEKFILSDLAMDTVANAKNRDDIKNLIGKGILEVDGKLKFVNRGFERYIKELGGSEELKSLDKNSKRSDGWNRVKLPIYVIFGAIVLFFFFTQQEIISAISAAILSITGLIGSLLKFGSSARSPEGDK